MGAKFEKKRVEKEMRKKLSSRDALGRRVVAFRVETRGACDRKEKDARLTLWTLGSPIVGPRKQ
jgi:hypothetical protein